MQITQRQQQMPAVTVWAAAQNPELHQSHEHCEMCKHQESDVKKVTGRGESEILCEPSPDKGEGCLPVVKGGLLDGEVGIGNRFYWWVDHIYHCCPPHTINGFWPPKMGFTALLASWMGRGCWVSSGAKEGFAWVYGHDRSSHRRALKKTKDALWGNKLKYTFKSRVDI